MASGRKKIKKPTLACEPDLHSRVKSHIGKFANGKKIQSWVAEALEEKMKRENPKK